MRDLIFKNLTSDDKRRKVITCAELIDQEGIRTNIYRHFVCRICNVKKAEQALPQPTLYVVKKRDSKSLSEAFYCRIKGSMYVINNENIYSIDFIHSLRISLKKSVVNV